MVEHVALQAQILKRLVSLNERKTRRDLVALARLETHVAVLDHVDAAVAVRACDGVELCNELRQRQLPPVKARRHASDEADLDIGGRVGRVNGVDGHRPDVRRGLRPRILEDAGLDGTAPEVIVDGIRLLDALRNRHAMLLGISNLVGAHAEVHSRTGAMTLREGSRAVMEVSKRTWSLPLPVHPWATLAAPYL